MNGESTGEKRKWVDRQMLKEVGLPEDLRERPPEEQLNIVNERIAEVAEDLISYEVRGEEGKEKDKLIDLLQALLADRFNVKKNMGQTEKEKNE